MNVRRCKKDKKIDDQSSVFHWLCTITSSSTMLIHGLGENTGYSIGIFMLKDVVWIGNMRVIIEEAR